MRDKQRLDSFTITSIDGSTQQVSFDIHGTNQAAVIGTPTVTDVTEGSGVNASGNLIASGSISILDVNQGVASIPNYGYISTRQTRHINPSYNGSYTYSVANNATEYFRMFIKQKSTPSLSPPSTAPRNKLSFDIHGTNQVAVIGTITVTDVTEEQ